MPRAPSRRLYLLSILVPFGIFLAHAAWVGGWIVDDAGISYAYARSLASGHGLVSQPGEAPVEGVTNLFWVALLAVPLSLGIFDPVVTPKVMAASLTLASFLAVGALLRGAAQPKAFVLAALAGTAFSTGFVVWSMSGLENALAATLVALLALLAARLVDPEGGSLTDAYAAGMTLFLLFCTRPDGVIYLPLIPLLIGWSGRQVKARARAYTLSFALPWLLLTAFRVAYFHDVVPNTYYAKGGAGWRQTLWLLERMPVLWAGALYALTLSALIVAAVTGAAAIGWKLRRRFAWLLDARAVLALFFAATLVVYAALPRDWMPHFRFATAAFLLGPPAILMLTRETLLRALPRRAAGLTLAALVIFPLAALVHGALTTRQFVAAPIVPFDHVRALALRIGEVALTTGRSRASVLLPDIGGALWEDRFRVVDLAGLCDATIARAMKLDKQRFYDYVLGERKPELIWVHSFWSRTAALPRDPRFGAAYATAWAESRAGDPIPYQALYVRRDLLRGAPEALGAVFRR